MASSGDGSGPGFGKAGAPPVDGASGLEIPHFGNLQNATIVAVNLAGDAVVLPEGFVPSSAEFLREGSDLVLVADDGTTVIVSGYFDLPSPPDLLAGVHGQIAGDLAARLAGSPVFEQVAQVGLPQPGDIQADIGEPIGRVAAINGNVSATRVDGTQVDLDLGDPVYQGDILVTGDGDGVGLVLADQTTFSMAENGRMVLDEMVYDPGSQDGNLSVSILEGVFTFVSGQIAKTSSDAMTIESPLATIGIRGTQGGIDFTGGIELNVVLMSESDASGNFVGEIWVTNNGGVSVLNTLHSATQVTGSNLPPSAPAEWDVDQVVGTFGEAFSLLPTINANANTYDVPPAGQQLTAEELEQLNAQGGEEFDEADAGAEEVLEELAEFETAAGGEEGEDLGGSFVSVAGEGPGTDEEGDDPGIAPLVLEGGAIGGGGGAGAGEEGAGGDDEGDEALGEGEEEEETFAGGGTTGNDNLVGGEGNDVIDGGSGDDTITDTSGNNTLSGGTGSDTITGGPGDDTIDGAAGDDTITDSGGKNTITGGSGSDTITGGTGDDTIDGGDGDDVITDPGGNNTITGGTGSDNITGGPGNDFMDGGSGDDTLFGQGGDDIVNGGADNDTIIAGSGEGDDAYDGGSGIDTIDYSSQTGGLFIDLQNGNASGGAIDSDTITGVENVIGGSGDDTIVGDADANRLDGGAGNDTLFGEGGADVLLGGDGNDTVIAGDDGSLIYGGSGNDNIIGDAGFDWMVGGAGNDTMNGGAGADAVHFEGDTAGVTVDMRLQSGHATGAGIGTDTILNVENIYGDLGNDTFINDGTGRRFEGRGGDDTFIGGTGNDVFIGGDPVSDTGTDTVDYSAELTSVTVNLAGGTATGATVGTDTLDGIENIVGGQGADVVTGDGGANDLSGDNGDDLLTGGAGDDSLDGGQGTDTAVYSGSFASYAVAGNVAALTVSGNGEGNDTLTAVETLQFADGTFDVAAGVFVPAGSSLVNFTAGTDSFQGTAGDDILLAGGNAEAGDSVDGLGGDDTLTLADGGNTVTVSNLETVVGGAGADDITATGNTDASLQGGGGDDTLTGGGGDDDLIGGAGTDTAVFTGTFNEYTLTPEAGGDLTVAHGGGNPVDGVDILSAVEFADFADGTFDIANQVFVPQGSAGLAFTTGVDTFGVGNGTTSDDDTLVGIGSAETGDSVDGGDGFDSLSLGGLGNVLTIANIETLTGGAGADSITVTGAVDDAGGLIGGLDGADVLINQATIDFDDGAATAAVVNQVGGAATAQSFAFNGGLTLFDGTFDFRGTGNAISGGLDVDGGTLEVQGVSGIGTGALVVNGGLVNDATVRLDDISGGNAVTLSVTGGQLVNNGLLQVSDFTGANQARTITAEVVNNGLFDVDQHTTVINTGTQLINAAGGTIDLDFGGFLTVSGGETVLEADSSLIGSGRLSVNSGDLTLNQNTAFDTASLQVAGGQVGGTGDLSVNTFGVFSTATIGVDYTNTGNTSAQVTDFTGDVDIAGGTLAFRGAGNGIEGALSIGAGGTLEVQGLSGIGTGSLTVDSGFTNLGTVRLDDLTGANAVALTVGGSGLLNSGTLEILDTTGAGLGRTVTGQVSNFGLVDIDQDTTIANTGTFANFGEIDVADGEMLTVSGGTLELGSGTQFTGGGQISVAGGGTVSIIDDITLDTPTPTLDYAGTIALADGGLTVDLTGVNTVAGLNLLGGAGDDFIGATQNGDTIDGAAGDDSLFGGGGNDTLSGGLGDDIALYQGNFADYDISGDIDGLTVSHTGGTPVDGTDLLDGVETLQFADLVFDVAGGGLLTQLTFTPGTDTFTGTGDPDSFVAVGNAGAGDSLDGGGGNDTLTLADGGNILSVSGTETVNGGTGADDITVTDATDTTINAGDGDDTLTGGTGDDTLNGGADIDTAVYAGNFADYTVGALGDSVSGAEGDDTLSGIEFIDFADGTYDVAGQTFGGAEFAWLGGISDDWQTGGNWSTGSPPADDADVTIDGDGAPSPIPDHAFGATSLGALAVLSGGLEVSGGTFAAAQATFDSDALLRLSGGELNGALTTNGDFFFEGGTLSGDGAIVNGDLIFAGLGIRTLNTTLTLNGSGTMANTQIDGSGLLDIAGVLGVEDTSFINAGINIVSGGELRVEGSADTGSFTATIDQGFDNAGLLVIDHLAGVPSSTQLVVSNGSLDNLAGGTILVQDTGAGGFRTMSANLNNAGLFDVDFDASLNGNVVNQSGGVFDIAGGTTLDVDGEGFLNQAGATLQGTGTLDVQDSLLVNQGGTLSAGNSVGTLSVLGDASIEGGVIEVEIGAGGTTDLIDVSGVLTFDRALVEFSFLDGFTPTDGQDYTFMTYGGLSGSQDPSYVISGIADGFSFGALDFFDGNAITATAVGDAVAAAADVDLFFGAGGDDDYDGGAGDDVLTGGGGDDDLVGGAGSDTAVFSDAFAEYNVLGTVASSTVHHVGGGGGDGFDFLQGIETLRFADGTFDIASGVFSGFGGDTDIAFTGADDDFVGTANDDRFIVSGSAEAGDSIDGGDGTDEVDITGAGNQVFELNNIELLTAAGQDVTITNAVLGMTVDGVGELDLAAGSNIAVFGGSLINATGGVTVSVGDNTGVVFGGGNGVDNFTGGGGSDFIQGGVGADILTGGAGADTFVVSDFDQFGDIIIDFDAASDLFGFEDFDALSNLAFSRGEGGQQIFQSLSLAGTLNEDADIIAVTESFDALGSLNPFSEDDVANVLSGMGDGNFGENSQTGFIVGDDVDSVFWYWDDGAGNGDGVVDAAELSLIAEFLDVTADEFTAANFIGYNDPPTQQNVAFTAGEGNDAFTGTAGDDEFVASGQAESQIFTDPRAYDLVDGGDGFDTLFLGDSGDILEVRNMEYVHGGGGSDAVYLLDNVDHVLIIEDVEIVNSFAGRDFITVGPGDSGGGFSMSANAGDDVIVGGSGDDRVSGGSGQDTLQLGAGDDTFRFFNTTDFASGPDIFVDFTAGGTDDTIEFNGETLLSVRAGGNSTGFQQVTVGGAIAADSGVVVLTDTGAIANIQDSASVAPVLQGLTGLDAGDSLYFVVGDGVNSALWRASDISGGGPQAGEIQHVAMLAGVADPSAFTIDDFEGFGTGRTVLDFNAGTVSFTGTAGDDDLIGVGLALAPDSVDGAGGDDTLEMQTTGSHILDIASIETVLGSAGNDTFTILNGNTEGTLFDMGAGDDLLRLLEGVNTIAVQNVESISTFGAATDDTLTLTQSVFGIDITLGADANDTLILADGGNDVTVTAVRNVFGGAGNDSITADGNSLVVADGGAGDDTITGDFGDDELTGGTGDDTLVGGGGFDLARYAGNFADYDVSGGVGSLEVAHLSGAGADGTDDLSGIEFLEFADGTYDVGLGTFTGSLTFTAGTDTFGAADGFTAGDDTFVAVGLAGSGDTVDGLGGFDTLTLDSGINTLGVSNLEFLNTTGDSNIVQIENAVTGITINMTAGSGDILTFLDTANVTVLGAEFINAVDAVSNDVISLVDATAAVVAGFAGDDQIFGGGGSDTIDGGDGADTISGGAGNDTIVGGAGNDILQGGSGSDIFAYDSPADFGTTGDTIADFNTAFDSFLFDTSNTVPLTRGNADTFQLVADGSAVGADTVFAAFAIDVATVDLLDASFIADAINGLNGLNAGDQMIFGCADGADTSRLYYWDDAGGVADGLAAAGELSTIATISGIATATDFEADLFATSNGAAVDGGGVSGLVFDGNTNTFSLTGGDDIAVATGAAAAGDSVNGLAGTDSLFLDGLGNTLAVTSIESLIGGAGADVISTGNVIAGLYDLGAGTDSLTLSSGGAYTFDLANIESVAAAAAGVTAHTVNLVGATNVGLIDTKGGNGDTVNLLTAGATYEMGLSGVFNLTAQAGDETILLSQAVTGNGNWDMGGGTDTITLTTQGETYQFGATNTELVDTQGSGDIDILLRGSSDIGLIDLDGAGTDSDSVELADASTYTFGLANVEDVTVTFTGVTTQNINLNSATNVRLIDLAGGTDSINLQTAGATYELGLAGVENFNGLAGDETIRLSSATNPSGLMDLGAGTDTITLTTQGATYEFGATDTELLNTEGSGDISLLLTAGTSIDLIDLDGAGGDNDVIELADAGTYTFGLANVESVTTTAPGVTSHTVNLVSAANVGTIDLQGGTDFLNLTTSGGSYAFNVANIENITGAAGDETVTLTGANGANALFNLAGGTDTLNLFDGANTVSVQNVEAVNGGTGLDTVNIAQTGENITVTGVETVNLTSATAMGTTLSLSGTLLLDGNLQNENVTLSSAVNGLTVNLGLGNDVLSVFEGTNSLSVSGVETIQGSDNNSVGDDLTLTTDPGAVTIDLRLGDDALALSTAVNGLTVIGGAGTDELTLADGNNNIFVESLETVTGGTGIDTVDLGGSSTTTTLDLGGGTDMVTISGSNNTASLTGVESVILTATVGSQFATVDLGGAASVFGSSADQTLTLTGNVFSVTVSLGDGTDVLNLADGSNVVAVGGVETVNGNNGFDQITIGDGTAAVNAGGGNDTVFGGAGDDTIDGQAGDDTLRGGGGDDTLTGGTGADTFAYDSPLDFGTSGDTIIDFTAGEDSFLFDTSGTVPLSRGAANTFQLLTDGQTLGDDTIFAALVTEGSIGFDLTDFDFLAEGLNDFIPNLGAGDQIVVAVSNGIDGALLYWDDTADAADGVASAAELRTIATLDGLTTVSDFSADNFATSAGTALAGDSAQGLFFTDGDDTFDSGPQVTSGDDNLFGVGLAGANGSNDFVDGLGGFDYLVLSNEGDHTLTVDNVEYIFGGTDFTDIDITYASATTGVETLQGESGTDTVRLANTANDITLLFMDNVVLFENDLLQDITLEGFNQAHVTTVAGGGDLNLQVTGVAVPTETSHLLLGVGVTGGQDSVFVDSVDLISFDDGFDHEITVTDIDEMYGGDGVQNVTVNAASAGTYFYGAGNDDIFVGGNGDDFIWGAGEDDILTGNGGADRFNYEAYADIVSGADTITDFSTAEDIFEFGTDTDSMMLTRGDADEFQALIGGMALGADTAFVAFGTDVAASAANYAAAINSLTGINANDALTVVFSDGTDGELVYWNDFLGGDSDGVADAFEISVVADLDGIADATQFNAANFATAAGAATTGGGSATFIVFDAAPNNYVGDAADETLIGVGSADFGDFVDGAGGTDSLTLADGGNSLIISAIENLVGGSGADTITASGSTDVTFTGGGGDDDLTGGSGTDTAIYTGEFSEYVVGGTIANFSVEHVDGGLEDGEDSLEDIEFLEFTDGTYDVAGGFFLPSDIDVAWASQDSGNWTTAANWSTGVQPQADDFVFIGDQPGNPVITFDAGVTEIDGLLSFETLTVTTEGLRSDGLIRVQSGLNVIDDGHIIVRDGLEVTDTTGSEAGNVFLSEDGDGSIVRLDFATSGGSATDQTFDNAFVTFDETGGGNALLRNVGSGTLTLGSSLAVFGGRGVIGTAGAGGAAIINQGSIIADASGFGITFTADIVSNEGTMTADLGDLTFFGNTFLANSGTILADTGDVVISGNVAATNTGDITADGGTVTITGTALFDNLGDLTTANGGAVTVLNATVTNTGTIDVGGGSTLSIDDGIVINATGGIIDGTGDILLIDSGQIVNDGGTIRPGGNNTTGTLNVTGDIDLGTGILDIEIAAASHDFLDATGEMALGGRLLVGTLGADPIGGKAHKILEWGTTSGAFEAINGLSNGADTIGDILYQPFFDATGLFLTSRAATDAGTAGDDTLNGSGADDYIVGGDGNDLLVGSGGNDVLFGENGDDTFQTTDDLFDFIDGGRGVDTLEVSNYGLDLTGIRDDLLMRLEVIEMVGGGAESVTFSVDDVLGLTEDTNDLLIGSGHAAFDGAALVIGRGAPGDAATIADLGNWTEIDDDFALDRDGVGGDESYTVFDHDTENVRVYIENVS